MSLGISAMAADELIASSVSIARTARQQFLNDNPGNEIRLKIRVFPTAKCKCRGSSSRLAGQTRITLKDWYSRFLETLP